MKKKKMCATFGREHSNCLKESIFRVRIVSTAMRSSLFVIQRANGNGQCFVCIYSKSKWSKKAPIRSSWRFFIHIFFCSTNAFDSLAMEFCNFICKQFFLASADDQICVGWYEFGNSRSLPHRMRQNVIKI